MDPDQNFRERIALLRAAGSLDALPPADAARFDALTAAYAEWRAAGGFTAYPLLRRALLALL